MCGEIAQSSWLRKMLKCSFYKDCSIRGHPQTTMFCLNCESEPFCELCSKAYHGDHKTLRVFKASHEVVVRVEHVQKLMDDYGTIQPFSINSFAILFLQKHSRGQKNASEQSPTCEMCQVKLKSPDYNYCSIACKMGFQEKNQSSNPTSVSACIDVNSQKSSSSGDGNRDQEEVNSDQRRKRRKGIPQRSPFR